MVKKHEIVVVANYSKDSPLTLKELCEICNITEDVVEQYISYEIIHPKRTTRQEILFELVDLQRAKTALRLQHDLEVNLAGVALALDLLEELEELREKMKFLEKQL